MLSSNRKILSGSVLSLALMLVTLATCTKTAPLDKNTLAQINDLKVTTAHFENRFKEVYYRTGQVLTPDETSKLTILNNTFSTYVLATFAKDMKLDQTREASFKLDEIKARVLTEEYLEQAQLADIEVTEAEIAEYFIRFNSILQASHLYAPTLEEANVLYARLQKGELFENLAKEVFQHPYLANNGGDVGSFTTDEMDIAFENAAFKLKVGEISKPVQTAQGYSIVKLTDRYTKPILTEYELAVKKPQITGYVYGKKKELKSRALMNDFINSLEIDTDVFDRIWEKLNPNYALAISKNAEFLGSLNETTVLAKNAEFSFTMNDFIHEFFISPEELIYSIEDKATFRNFIIGTAYRAYMIQKALEQGIDKQKLVQESIQETYIHYLANTATGYLKSTIQNSEEELYQEFITNKERFDKPFYINLARIEVDTEELAEQILTELKNGASFTKMVKEHSINHEDIMTDGELGFENIQTYGFDGPKFAQLKVGELSEIIHNQTGKYQIYKCLGKEEAAPRSFEEARKQVNDFLTEKKLKSLRVTTIESVKKQHHAIVDTLKLKELTIQI